MSAGFNSTFAYNEARRETFWVLDGDLEIEVDTDFERTNPIVSVKAHIGFRTELDWVMSSPALFGEPFQRKAYHFSVGLYVISVGFRLRGGDPEVHIVVEKLLVLGGEVSKVTVRQATYPPPQQDEDEVSSHQSEDC